uniref:Cytochrome P450 monooxygenase CYP393B3 n=1 Tax=Euwallacea interjectus TaxID=321055 RepID=A0A9Y1YYH4_9CUCU|nr:cytochrome P450 monooxygenase CYP393B3 [Euwallacea interjectus]
MSLNSFCFTEQLTFLKYVNEYYLFYSITLLTFASLFALVWILQKYTYFEKIRLARASLPTFPYGNLKEVFKRETSLHVYLWKYYNRFKRKSCKYGGMFVFVKPALLIIDSAVSSKLNSDSESFEHVVPRESKLKREDVKKILQQTGSLNNYIRKFCYSTQGVLPEKLLKADISTTFKDFLLEATCLAFGFKPLDVVDEINELLKQKYQTSYRFYLSLCIPWLRTKRDKLDNDLKEILMDIVESRKKNDSDEIDLIESFISLYNSSEFAIRDISNELFHCFADTLTFSHSTLMMCLYELAGNREIQDEVLGEIRRFNKKNRNFDYENINELTYLDAVVKETLRKYPPIATIITCSKCKDKPSFDWYPDKNALFFQSILGVQRDPKNYTKPEAFEPDRFTESRTLDKDKNVYLPLGIGPMSDLYVKLITLQVKLVLASIFSQLEVRFKGGTSSSLKYNPGLLYLCPNDDFQLEFSRF